MQSGKVIWNPSMRANKLTRVLIMGKAVVGAEAPAETPKKKEEENEFDMDSNDRRISLYVVVTPTSSSQVVNPGSILNHFEDSLRGVQDCIVIDVDKKQLKHLCMLLRWKFFGVGISNRISFFSFSSSLYLFSEHRLSRLCWLADMR